jgi:hypothetical protein
MVTADTVPFITLAETIVHYDEMREHHTEYAARWLAIRYLLRKLPATMDDLAAGEIIADALARRATCRILEARADIVQGARGILTDFGCECREPKP